jgi:hypothetical protein
MRVGRIDYSKEGLSKVPNDPIGIKYLSDTEDSSIFYRGINTNEDNKFIEYTEERVPGYKDFTMFYPGMIVGNSTEDTNLYKSTDIYDESSVGYRSSLIKFEGQQYKGSLMEYHYFVKAADFINKLEIPKVLNNYSIFNVRKVINAVNRTEYLIASDYNKFETVWSEKQNSDLSYDNSYITVYLDPSFTIPKDAIIEVTLEVVPTNPPDLGLTTSNSGPNIQAYRAPFVANYNVGSKGVESLYKASLFNVTVIDGQRVITVDLSTVTNDLKNGLIMGLSSYSTRNKTYQSYIWYKASALGNPYYVTVPVNYVENLGTSAISIWIDESVTLNAGSVYIPMLVKQTEFSTSTNTKIMQFIKL